MFLYSLTVQAPTHTVQAVSGQFAGTREQFIVTASGSHLALLQLNPELGTIKTVLTHDVFGIIRSLAPFRVTGSSKGKPPPCPRKAKPC